VTNLQPPTRPVRSDDEKCEALRHVGYELLQCVECGARLQRWEEMAMAQPDGDAPVVFNALLEAHLLHARSVIEFLVRPIPRQPGQRDLLRTDLLPSGCYDWVPAPAQSVTRLNGHWRDLNGHLSHLSWDRVEDDRRWNYSAVASDVLAVVQAWTDWLSQQVSGVVTQPLRAHLLWARRALDNGTAPGTQSVTTTNSTLVSTSRPWPIQPLPKDE
jgi:hypothetical protein